MLVAQFIDINATLVTLGLNKQQHVLMFDGDVLLGQCGRMLFTYTQTRHRYVSHTSSIGSDASGRKAKTTAGWCNPHYTEISVRLTVGKLGEIHYVVIIHKYS